MKSFGAVALLSALSMACASTLEKEPMLTCHHRVDIEGSGCQFVSEASSEDPIPLECTIVDAVQTRLEVGCSVVREAPGRVLSGPNERGSYAADWRAVGEVVRPNWIEVPPGEYQIRAKYTYENFGSSVCACFSRPFVQVDSYEQYPLE